MQEKGNKGKSAMTQVANLASTYLHFLEHEATTCRSIFYSPQDEMLVQCRVTTIIKFTGIHLYTWVERGTVTVKHLA